jgi:hypothetical protein
VAIAGQSHGRVVAALSASEILSAGEPANGNRRFRRNPSAGARLQIGAFGDCLLVIVKRQEESYWVSLDDFAGGR